jgi:hypothetical protein
MFGSLKKQAEKSPALHAGQLQPRIKHLAFQRALHEAGMTAEQVQSGDTDAIAELRRQTAQEFEQRQDNHRLSTQLMIRRGGFWRLYDEE